MKSLITSLTLSSTLLVYSQEASETVVTEEVEVSEAPSEVVNEPSIIEDKDTQKAKLAANKGSIYSRPNARVMTLSTPGARGAIFDRNGKPLAVSKISWFPALQFKQFEHENKEEIIAWGRERIEKANEIWGLKWNPKDEAIWEHYRNRRWMAMPYTFFVVNEALKLETEDLMIEGLVLHPIFQRYYPHGKSAAHIIGYTGIKGKLEKGPINYGDPIFPYTHGKAGLELMLDAQLSGKRGLTRHQYASDGTEFPDEVIQPPTIGANVITTLNLDWQKHAEKVLRQKTKKGALVVIDIQTGEVVVMASQPSFDPNIFIPRALTKDFKPLLEDEGKPLYARAFQAAYPPASAFKPIVALAGLQNGYISRNSTLYCPAYLEYNNHKFWDWSKDNRGDLNVVSALVISNNPFFYNLGNQMKSGQFVDFARRFGFGAKTGLPLVGENTGNMPDNTWMKKYHRRNMHRGDHYNNAIGQGVLLATPLQVAQGMAAIANGKYLPKLQLVRQIQDQSGRVIAANKPDSRAPLEVDPIHVATIKEGMMKVVNSKYGTGRSGSLSFATLCGKTGTGQWKPAKEQYVAWFAGFFPLREPKFAFAVLYEGDEDEQISGGKKAAPIVRAFFNPLKSDVKKAISPPAKAVIVVETPEAKPATDEGGNAPPKALIIDPETGEEVIPKALVSSPTDESEQISEDAINEDSAAPEEEEIPQAQPVKIDQEDPPQDDTSEKFEEMMEEDIEEEPEEEEVLLIEEEEEEPATATPPQSEEEEEEIPKAVILEPVTQEPDPDQPDPGLPPEAPIEP